MTSTWIRRALLFTLAAAACAQQIDSGLFKDLHWRNIGPFRGGRTRAAAGVPSQPNVFYMGQVNGGVWKSDDYGRTWTPIFDSQPTGSIGAIAVAPSDPNIIYVASGEGLQRPDLSVGDGIYKSTDAGQTWTHLGLRDGQQIPALAVDPRDANHLFAAVLGHPYGPNEQRGVFVSTDGGQNWQKALYVDENTGASDIAMDPSNPDVLYASLWECPRGPVGVRERIQRHARRHLQIHRRRQDLAEADPGSCREVAQAYVAIAPSDPRRLYATVAAGREVGIYRSDDAGENWHRATTDAPPGEPHRRRRSARAARRSQEPRYALQRQHRHLALHRRRPDLDRHQRRARRRRLSEYLDQSQQPGYHPAGGRSGRARQREPRTHLEFLVQPAHRAALSRRRRQRVSRIAFAPGSRKAARSASPAAATMASSPFANGIPWA